ncbi:hypothetical protein FRB95_005227 [Tulasnella sp. JGI-2019a]|nr:hypothetical protein FRB95_005227 [Tulasnella sp. JGI-2019a]
MMSPPDFKGSDVFGDVSYGYYMGQRLPGLKNTVFLPRIQRSKSPKSLGKILNYGLSRPLMAVVPVPEAQLAAVANNFLLASSFNLSLGADASVIPYSSSDAFPDIDLVHGHPLQGPIVVASNSPGWYQKPIEQTILPKLAHSFRLNYHLVKKCAIQPEENTFIPNATDFDVNAALEKNQGLDHYHWRRVRTLRNEVGITHWLYSDKDDVRAHADATLAQYLDDQRPISGAVMFSYMSPQLVGLAELEEICRARKANRKNIQPWIQVIREMGRVTSTRHFILYTGEYAVLAIFDPRYDTIAFSPIEQLDTSTSADDALPLPQAPTMFQLITQAMVDAKLSKEDNAIPADTIVPHGDLYASLDILRFPYEDIARTTPRELVGKGVFYNALRHDIKAGGGHPVFRRQSTATPSIIPVEATAGEGSAAGGHQQANGSVSPSMGEASTSIIGATTPPVLVEALEVISHDVEEIMDLDAEGSSVAGTSLNVPIMAIAHTADTQSMDATFSPPSEPASGSNAERMELSVQHSPRSLSATASRNLWTPADTLSLPDDDLYDDDGLYIGPADELGALVTEDIAGPSQSDAPGPSQSLPSPNSEDSTIVASDHVHTPSIDHNEATVARASIPAEILGAGMKAAPIVLEKRKREEEDDPCASPSAWLSRRTLPPRKRDTSPAVESEGGATCEAQEEQPRPAKKMRVGAEAPAQPEAGPSNAASPKRSLRARIKVDYTGRSNQDRAVETTKTAKERVKMEAVVPPRASEDPVADKEKNPADVKAAKKVKVPKGQAAKRVAVADAQKKAKLVAKVEEKRTPRTPREDVKGKGREGSGPSKRK